MKDEELNTIKFAMQNIENFEEHLFKKINKKRAEKGKGPIGKKLVDKVAKVGKKLGADKALVTPLVPFKGAMKKKLAKLGVKPKSNKMIDVATAFYENVIQKKNLEEGRENIEPVTITLIVTGIVSFFKALKEKRDKGEASVEEQELAADADDSVSDADDMEEEDIEAEVTGGSSKGPNKSASGGGFAGMDTTTILILVAAVALIFFVSRRG